MWDDPGFLLAAFAAAICVGLSKGGWSAFGMLGVPIMSLATSPLVAAGILLPVLIVSDIFGVIAYRRRFEPRLLWIMIPAGLLGIALGWATASIVSERAVTGVLGIVTLLFALNLLLRDQRLRAVRKMDVGRGYFWGILAGFTSFISHSGAPPYQIYVLPLRLEKEVFAGTTTIFFAAINLSKLLPYWALGQLNFQNVEIALAMMIPAVASVYLGLGLVRRVSSNVFYGFISWALLVIALKLIWDAVTG